MSFAAKIETLPTGETSILLFNRSEAWQRVFASRALAAKEAERLGVFDSTTRRLFEHVTASTDCGYLQKDVQLRTSRLLESGFTRQP